MKINFIKPSPFLFWNFSISALFWLLPSHSVTAQIVPDTTLPNNSIVIPSDKTSIITGGTQAGSNLFHSFKEFSVLTNREAFFSNASDIQNIISRVTGRSISNIDGLLQANGAANLFFINPNGIIFGPNASLNIGGSFVASTAESLRFGDGIEFSATNPQATPILTISVPLGLQFASNPGRIVNQSQASPDGAVNSVNFPVGLQVPNGKTLALVGGHVSLQDGNLTTAGGRIEIGSVGTGLVKLTEIPQGYSLGYADIKNFQDIQVSGGAVIDASGDGGGDIQVQGRNINLTDNAAILSSTLGADRGGNVTVEAAESVNLSGDNASLSTYTLSTGSAGDLIIKTRKLTVESGAFIQTPSLTQGQAGDILVRATDSVELSGGTVIDGEFLPSGLSAQVVQNAGNGGNLTIETGRLTIRDGAAVDASTFGTANAGNVQVRATDIEVVGFATTPNGTFPSGIFAQVADQAVDNAGDAGTLSIETQRLTVMDGAQISTVARKEGNGGDLTINASDSIKLSGTLPIATASPLDSSRSGIFVSAQPGATGNVGNLNLTTRLLTVENGARITADNLGIGQRGNATLNVSQMVIRNGGAVRAGSFAEGSGGTLTVNATESVNVSGTGTISSSPVVSTLSTAATASGNAGSLNIITPNLTVQDGAEVTVSGTGSGSAGNLSATANNIFLDRGSLTATTNAGEGANIRLQNLDLLLMQNQSLISAQAFNDANGGNITIDANNGFIVALPNQNNDIIASALRGRGGEINITTSNIFGIKPRRAIPGNITNDIDASSEFGLAGSINLNILQVQPIPSLVELPARVVDASSLVASTCSAIAAGEGSSLVVTGRGGLPPSPEDPLSGDIVWVDTRLSGIANHQAREQTSIKLPSKANTVTILPATGWVFNGKGDVTLISHAQSEPVASPSCPKQ